MNHADFISPNDGFIMDEDGDCISCYHGRAKSIDVCGLRQEGHVVIRKHLMVRWEGRWSEYGHNPNSYIDSLMSALILSTAVGVDLYQ